MVHNGQFQNSIASPQHVHLVLNRPFFMNTQDVPKIKKLSFFDFLMSINEGSRGKNLFADPTVEDKSYVSFMVNRGLSHFSDTVLLANEMNQRATIPVRSQYDFLRFTIRPRKRFSGKWGKNEDSETIELIKEACGFSSEKARQVLPLFTPQAIEDLKKKIDKGGKVSRKK